MLILWPHTENKCSDTHYMPPVFAALSGRLVQKLSKYDFVVDIIFCTIHCDRVADVLSLILSDDKWYWLCQSCLLNMCAWYSARYLSHIKGFKCNIRPVMTKHVCLAWSFMKYNILAFNFWTTESTSVSNPHLILYNVGLIQIIY